MKEWVIHWIVDDIYDPVWPNILASGICTIVIWLKLHTIHRHLKRQSGDNNHTGTT